MSAKNELVELMKAKGLNQTQVARAIGKSSAVISQYRRCHQRQWRTLSLRDSWP